MTQRSPAPDHRRRRVLAGIGTLATAAFAGCLSDTDDDADLEPIALTDGQTCDVCGMVIADHYGPAGQIFYADDNPDDRDGPAWFDSVTELLEYRVQHAVRGWTDRAVFVTDYSTVDYELIDGDERPHISTHAAAAAFADATECYYVAESEVRGAMGEDYFPFSSEADAEAFAAEYDGTVHDWNRLADD